MRRKPRYIPKLEKIKERDKDLRERWQPVEDAKKEKTRLRFATLERVSTEPQEKWVNLSR